jgi:undecaprenyl diphosphate synthase
MHRDLKIPKHVAFIMDGNGRWAKKRMMPRTFGHRAGTENLRKIITHARNYGIRYVTFYAFSTENWKRPGDEVSALMEILFNYLKKETRTFVKEGARLNVLGDLSRFPEKLREAIEESMNATAHCQSIDVNIALNYSGRSDILQAVNRLIEEKKEKPLDEEMFSKYLYTKGIPDPDLMIRTSGELRLSNYMLWQLAYTELYFTDVFWPDFDIKAFDEALIAYTARDRRFGEVHNA